MFRANRFYLALLISLLALVCWALAVFYFSPWDAVVSGQTVPRTPPPTWTRTPRATATRPPTESPFITPSPTWTLVPGAPTPVPQPLLWVSLLVQPTVAGPGDLLRISCLVGNRGQADGGRIEVMLPIGPLLSIEQAANTAGVARAEGGLVIWVLESLPPQAEASLMVQVRVPLNASPGQRLPMQARLVSESGELLSEEQSVDLPWALLPATGG